MIIKYNNYKIKCGPYNERGDKGLLTACTAQTAESNDTHFT